MPYCAHSGHADHPCVSRSGSASATYSANTLQADEAAWKRRAAPSGTVRPQPRQSVSAGRRPYPGPSAPPKRSHSGALAAAGRRPSDLIDIWPPSAQLVQALGNAAYRRLIPIRYTRLADICDDLNRARIARDGSYFEKMDAYKPVALLLVDDFMTTPISTQNSVDLFEIMEAREGRRATVVASQLEPNEWYLRIEGELMADSILNRVATGARRMDPEGPNMRERFAKKRTS